MRWSFVSAITVVLVWLLAGSAPALALNPALDVSQYAHTSWRIRDGLFKDVVGSMAQTPDGYLWLGTELGLLRFDGVRFTSWHPPQSQSLPHIFIRSLCVGRDGTLWIGTLNGLASWKDGVLSQYPEVQQSVDVLLEDRRGVVWAGQSSGASRTGSLCAIRSASVQCRADGVFGQGVRSLYEDGAGQLWAAAETGLWRWMSGAPTRYAWPDAVANSLQVLTEGDNRALLIATRGGMTRFANGEFAPFPVPTAASARLTALLRDRDGGLWIGTDSGLLHVHRGRTDAFTLSDGLSGNYVIHLFEDREGSVWVATTSGLDRFRETAVTTISVTEGLPHGAAAVLASRDGALWLSTNNVLAQWKNGQISGSGDPTPRLRGLVSSLLRDDRDRTWVASRGGIGYLDNGKYTSIPDVGGGEVNAIVEDPLKNLWILNQTLGLVHITPDHAVQLIPWSRLGHDDHAFHGTADPVRGGLWLGFYVGGVVYYADGQVRASYGAKDGLGTGRVNHLRIDKSGTLWVGTEGGLSRVKGERIATLTSVSGLPCAGVLWTIEDDSDSVWLRTACGLVRVRRTELDAAADAIDKDKAAPRTIQATVFDSSDGVRSGAIVTTYSPQVDKSADGRIWFADFDGLNVVDPAHLPFNPRPPPVSIEEVTADGRKYETTSAWPLRLPALTHDLRIDYTALSFVAPEKMRFKYLLEGSDHEWQDVGTQRQAFYQNLKPRRYRFRVIASNNSGVWNETGAVLEFSVDPAYYQTAWFAAAVVGTALLLITALYVYRARQVAQRYTLQVEARVNERTRIARDLHDTLLQSFHAVVLRFRAATYLLPEQGEARKTFDSAIDDASKAIVDARDAVQGLRASTDPATTVVDAIAALAKELETEHSSPSPPQFILHVEGTPGILQPLVRDDVYRIAREALRNAFRHSGATRIEADVRYDKRQFRLRIRDDGKGIDDKVAAAGGTPGHYGLAGMRERAELLGGTFTLWSERGSGTEIELTIPSSIAYGK